MRREIVMARGAFLRAIVVNTTGPTPEAISSRWAGEIVMARGVFLRAIV